MVSTQIKLYKPDLRRHSRTFCIKSLILNCITSHEPPIPCSTANWKEICMKETKYKCILCDNDNKRVKLTLRAVQLLNSTPMICSKFVSSFNMNTDMMKNGGLCRLTYTMKQEKTGT